MTLPADLVICGDAGRGRAFAESMGSGRLLFSLVTSYTATCEIPGITIAGADAQSLKFTPPADAEYLHYGHCKTISGVPMTPDGKPTPALLTKTALASASIPHLVINAGGLPPKLPYVETGLPPGRNISGHDAMAQSVAAGAVEYGRIMGRTLAALTDCLVIGESIPGGTTTAMAVLWGLGFEAGVSSSMPENPLPLKEEVVYSALSRMGHVMYDDGDGFGRRGAGRAELGAPDPSASSDPEQRQRYMYRLAAGVGDPMILFVAGMLSSASASSKVLLAGGTQMAAVLALASGMGFESENVAVGTTSYVAGDPDAGFAELVAQVADVPALVVDPGLEESKHPGLRAFASGFAKEGAGAGGCMISAMLKSGIDSDRLLQAADAEYDRLSSILP